MLFSLIESEISFMLKTQRENDSEKLGIVSTKIYWKKYTLHRKKEHGRDNVIKVFVYFFFKIMGGIKI